MKRAVPVLVLTLGLVAVAAGCGEDDAPPANGPGGQAPAEAGSEPPSKTVVELPAPPPVEAGERIVFFGDSLSLQAPPNYPELLPDELAADAPDVETTNVSEPGTGSGDWTPGSPLFEQRLRPALAEAGLVAVTVGGNDLEAGLGGLDGLDALRSAGAATDAAARLDAAGARIGRNLKRTFAAIRRINPGAEIVYISYPDYSRAGAWREAGGELGSLALRSGLGQMLQTAREAGPDLVVDLLTPTSDPAVDIDALLADREYLSPAGHQLYAEEIAAALTSEPSSP